MRNYRAVDYIEIVCQIRHAPELDEHPFTCILFSNLRHLHTTYLMTRPGYLGAARRVSSHSFASLLKTLYA